MNFFKSSMLGMSVNAINNRGDYTPTYDSNQKKGGGKKKNNLRFNGEPETRTVEQKCLLMWSR